MSFIFAVNLHPCYNQQDIPLSHSSYTGLHLAQFSQVHFGMYNNKYGSPTHHKGSRNRQTFSQLSKRETEAFGLSTLSHMIQVASMQGLGSNSMLPVGWQGCA